MVMDISTGSAFLLGLLGTGHCLGMCGPLVVALPGRYGRRRAHLFYHAGRILTYTLTGAILGALGSGLGYGADHVSHPVLNWTSRFQILMSLVSALLLAGLGLIRLGLLREPDWLTNLAPWKIPGYNATMGKIKARAGSAWLFVMGLMLGLLPCGLSYAAFARALSARSPSIGAVLTLAFGIGTLPGLLAVGSGAGILWRRFRVHMEMAAGLLMIGMAASLIMDIWTRFNG
jgi:sulfite exporter TauE/SafE